MRTALIAIVVFLYLPIAGFDESRKSRFKDSMEREKEQ